MERKRERKEGRRNGTAEKNNESEVWQFLGNTKKKRKVKQKNEIGLEEWENHFEILLEGTEEINIGKQRVRSTVELMEQKITAVKVKQAWHILNLKIAAGPDKISNEVWVYGGEDSINKLMCIIGNLWKCEQLPEDWKFAVIVSL